MFTDTIKIHCMETGEYVMGWKEYFEYCGKYDLDISSYKIKQENWMCK